MGVGLCEYKPAAAGIAMVDVVDAVSRSECAIAAPAALTDAMLPILYGGGGSSPLVRAGPPECADSVSRPVK